MTDLQQIAKAAQEIIQICEQNERTKRTRKSCSSCRGQSSHILRGLLNAKLAGPSQIWL